MSGCFERMTGMVEETVLGFGILDWRSAGKMSGKRGIVNLSLLVKCSKNEANVPQFFPN